MDKAILTKRHELYEAAKSAHPERWLKRIRNWTLLDKVWMNSELIQSAKNYKQRTGYYPEAIFAIKFIETRENLQFCKEHGIRLFGPPLGRPPKD